MFDVPTKICTTCIMHADYISGRQDTFLDCVCQIRSVVSNSDHSSFSLCIYGIPGAPKKYSGLSLDNIKTIEVITLKKILLDRGKGNLYFDILQLYIYKKLTEILLFQFGSIFMMCEKFAFTTYQIFTKRCST